MGPQGPAGPQGEDGYGTNWEIIPVTVRQSQWRYNDDRENNGDQPYFYYTLHDSRITNFIYSEGAVIVYLDFGGVRTPLPSIQHCRNENDELWTETIDFRYSPGEITFFFSLSDFFFPSNYSPPTRDFKILLMW
jgi:hypothetical protein